MRAMLILLVACGADSTGPVTTDGGLDGAGGGGGDGLDHYKSGSRIKTLVMTTPDGAKIFRGNHDSGRGDDCSFGVAADDVIRCLPASAAATLYGDAACTVRVALHVTCLPAPKYLHVPTGATVCGTQVGRQVFLRGAVRPSSFFLDGTCKPRPFDPQFTYYELGAEVAASEFVAGTLTVE